MRSAILVAGVCVGLSGCATLPTEQADGVPLARVEERVKCEIGHAYRTLKAEGGYPNLSKWAAGLTLSLTVDSTGSVLPSGSFTGLIGKISPLEFSLGATSNTKRTALLNVYVAFAEASRHVCEAPTSLSPLEHGLGLSDWIVRVFRAQRDVELMARANSKGLRASDFNSKDKSIGYTLEFVLTLSAGLTPNFIITDATAKAALSGETKSTHSLDIAMVEMKDAEFKEHFETFRISGKVTVKENTDPATKTLAPTITEREPDRTETRKVRTAVSVVGPVTKQRIDSILQQLNNKLLIQSLRR